LITFSTDSNIYSIMSRTDHEVVRDDPDECGNGEDGAGGGYKNGKWNEKKMKGNIIYLAKQG
jgi:hypothetical protein